MILTAHDLTNWLRFKAWLGILQGERPLLWPK